MLVKGFIVPVEQTIFKKNQNFCKLIENENKKKKS